MEIFLKSSIQVYSIQWPDAVVCDTQLFVHVVILLQAEFHNIFS